MTIVEMLGQSGVLTLLGMGIVFIFLFILVVVINQFGKISNRKSSDKDDVKPNLPAVSDTVINPDIIVAASAAVIEYRNNCVNSGGKE